MSDISNRISTYWHEANFKSRIILPVMFALTAVTSFAGFNFYQSEKNNLLEELNLKGQTLSTSLSAFAINPMANNNKNALRAHADKFLENQSSLQHVSFYKGDSPFLSINSDSVRQKLRPDTLKYYKAPIFTPDDSQQIGFVRISLSTQDIEDHLSVRLFEIILISTFTIIIASVLLSWLLEKAVISPLERLSHKIQMISHGRFNYKVPSDSWGEIGHLFKDINTLRIRFKKKQEELFSALLNRQKTASDHFNSDGQKILVVDDDEVIQKHAKKLLEKNNMDVLVANNGKQALDILKETPVDLVLLDLLMPEVSGFDVLNNIRQNKQFQLMPIIVVSSVIEKESIVKALNNGAVDYVMKPFNNQELMARVKTHLKKSIREKELEQFIEERLASLKTL